jgi:hypothetical protein
MSPASAGLIAFLQAWTPGRKPNALRCGGSVGRWRPATTVAQSRIAGLRAGELFDDVAARSVIWFSKSWRNRGGVHPSRSMPTPAALRTSAPSFALRLLDVLSCHDDAFGPHDVLAVVRHQLTLIAAHRQVARDALRTQLLRVESRWTEFAAFLSNDVGQTRRRDAYTDRALQFAREADDRDSTALALMRQGQWAVQELDAQRAVAFTQAALHVPGTSTQVRARCALRAANSHALAGDEPACQRRLDDAYELAEPSGTPGAVTRVAVRATEARSWLWMQPRRAIGLYEDALREWPRGQVRDGGVQQARLALACAAAGERGRAEAEGRKALAIARTTRSSVAARELKQLGEALTAR